MEENVSAYLTSQNYAKLTTLIDWSNIEITLEFGPTLNSNVFLKNFRQIMG